MQQMLEICDKFALELDMKFNVAESVAIRIGSRYNIQCSPLTLSGISLKYVSAVKYRGVYIVSAKCFKLSVDHLKVKFYHAFNYIYSRAKVLNSELVMVQVLKSYFLPFLLYESEAVRPSCSNVQSLENCINRAMFTIFHVGGNECIDSIRQFVGLPSLSILIERRQKFVDRLLTNNQCSKLFLMNVDN